MVGFYTESEVIGFRFEMNTDFIEYTYSIPPGTRYFGLYFYEYTQNSYETDRVIISNVTIFGDSNGGAMECLRCSDGTSSPGNAAFCTKCSPGYISTNGELCQACPANTFSQFNGSTSCQACNPGTFASEGSYECLTDCTFSPFTTFRLGNDSLISYNASQLKKDTLYGKKKISNLFNFILLLFFIIKRSSY